jgi:tRNA modification GTPase
VGVIRISGPEALAVSRQLTGVEAAARRATRVSLRDTDGRLLDDGLLICFPGPASFTGEDVAELHCHGGPMVLAGVLRACLSRGARAAAPGEFSQRAFLNGKIDLVQAEAIADLIASDSEAAARSATRSLTGAFSREVNAILTDLTRLRVFIEAAIDFPEEEVDFLADSDVAERMAKLQRDLEELLGRARRGRRLRDGLRVAIAGAPNAGKSSLLNQLAEQDSAIVTDIPGTTRDVLREHIEIDGLPLHIVDTAGLREASDAVEREGIRRAQLEFASADRILLVIDSSDPQAPSDDAAALEYVVAQLPAETPVTLIYNKIDLIDDSPRRERCNEGQCDTRIHLSARGGDGMDLLREHLLETAGLASREGSDFSARARHVEALEDTLHHVNAARTALVSLHAGELIAEDLRYAQDALGRITGKVSSDDLLGEIFGSFCIGK